eukprot:scaffold77143_cov33-Phaeocystis_antarctica.AAC.2
MRQIWACHVSSANIESGLGVRCPPFSAHFRGTIWSPRPKQRRCTGTNGTESTGSAKKTGLENLLMAATECPSWVRTIPRNTTLRGSAPPRGAPHLGCVWDPTQCDLKLVLGAPVHGTYSHAHQSTM